MKALILDQYGSVDNLRFGDIDQPEPIEDQILVRVVATSLNSWDWEIVSGQFMARLEGWSKPPNPVLGADVSGVVAAVGPNAGKFAVGDMVVGELTNHGWGGLAEFVCAPETAFALKPAELSFEDAASLPQAGELALQGIAAYPDLGPAHRVLIVGGGGGVGAFAIQMAKATGAHVTAVDRGSKLDLMRGFGADVVLDFEQVDFAKTDAKYDLIIDPVAQRSLVTYMGLLNTGGKMRAIGGSVSSLLQTGLIGPLVSKFTNRDVGILIWRSRTSDLETLLSMCVSGALKAPVGDVFPFAAAVEAFQRLGAGKLLGKAVIKVSD